MTSDLIDDKKWLSEAQIGTKVRLPDDSVWEIAGRNGSNLILASYDETAPPGNRIKTCVLDIDKSEFYQP